MEGRKRSRALSRTVYSVQKRLLAFVLAAAMILTNVGADLNTALAATSSESVTFSMSGSQLVKAIDEAIANGNEVTAEDLDFTNGKIAEFEKLFFGEGKIYEAFPDPDGGSMDAELRVFVRLPEDADDMYMVTGDEEIIFLYVNNGEDSISCTTEITRMDDGVEKVKKTKRVTVKSYEAAYGDEEVNLISKPVETPAPLPEDTNRPGADETTAPAETESQVETTAPSVDGTTAAPDDATDETTTAPDETTAADETQATLPDETTAAPEESQTEEPATTEAAEEKTQEATEPEKTEAPETEAPEAEAPEAEVGEPVASIIRHNAPLVADNENGDAAGTKEEAEAKEETEAPEPEKEEAPKETEAPTKEEATTAEETDATEAPTKEESTEATDSTDPTKPAQDATDETTTAADGETTVPGTDETTAAPVESGSGSADESETKAPAQTVPDVASPSEAKPTEAPAKDDNVSAAGTSDLVGIGYCSTAKVYVTTINQLKALDDFEGYKISYAIYPEASARIVEGPRGVEEGQALSFGVKNQIGYAVESVTANGEILSVDSITDNDDGSQTAWYSVPEIYEEQEVEVYMTETGEHPAVVFDPIVMEDGTVIHIQADEGVLPAGVQAVASVVYGIEDAVKANVEAEAEASGETKEVVAALSYNIDLLDAKGNKLDDQIWSGAVQVTFTGAPIEEKSREADVVEVMYVETTKEEVAQADISSGDVVSVEAVSEAIDVADGASIKSISFEANHFSVYTITFKSYITSAELKVYVMNSATGAELGSVNDGFDLWTSNVDAHKTSDLASDIIGKMGLTSTYRFDKATIGASYNSTSLGTVYYKGGTLYQTKSGNRYSNPITQLHFWFRAPLITFHANGGSGGPTSLSLSDGKITLPEPEDVGISNNGKTFVGWSTDPSGKGSVYIPKIEPSDSSIKEGAVLYAIWIDEDGTDSKNTAYFYIRIDGEIQYEPAGYGTSLYYPLSSAKTLQGSLKTPVSVNNNLDNVAANLQSKPTDAQIKTVLNGKLNYNPATQRIEWYVIKFREEANGRTYWNVDGVIRDNEKFELKYNPNGGDINVPGSNEYAAGSVVNVRFDTIPNRAGYDFLGWDENKDASYPTYTREGTNKTILINDNTELFAIWRQKGNVTINYAASVGGRVSRNYENLAPVTGVAQGSTAIANAGYHFVRWTNASGKEVSTEATYVPPKVGGLNVAATYTAHFEEDSNVTINYVAKDGGHVNKSNETLAPATGKAQGSRAVADEGYKFDGWYYDFSCTQKIVSGEMFIPTKESDDVWVNGTTYYAKFVVDEDKTKDLTATVDYRLGEEIQTGDHIDLKETVQVLQPDTLSTDGVAAKEYEGWKLDNITINGEVVESLPSTVNNGDAVVYNYEKETYDYIVEYYKGTLDSENKIGTSEKLSAKYHDPIILGFGTDNGQLDSMRPAGYLSGVQQEAPYIIGVKDNIIKVLYVADKVDYVVHMYYQTDGSYSDFDKATYVDMRQGFTDSEVEVTADDLLPVRDGYVLDTDAIGNRYKGTVIAGEEYLILRVYFKQQFTVTYEPGTYGVGIFNPSVTNELDYGSNTPTAPITELGTPGTGGYVFAGWTPKVEPTVTKDATYVAQWIPSDSTKYTVEFYYENAGKYPAAPDDISLRAGTTDATGAVTDTDKTAPAGYILDSNAANVFEAKITGDGNMVLRVYFKQQFTVTYNPGEHGSFDAQSSSGLSYGDKTPAFSGQTTANGNYRFSGWDKEIAETVTGNAVYTALWSYNSNTGGGSTGGGGGNPGRVTPSTDGGPGAVTINPEDVPLAQLPGAPVDPTVIDDGEIPLAALPKTGQSSVKSTLTMMMSGIFLMLTAMSKKRKEEDS